MAYRDAATDEYLRDEADRLRGLAEKYRSELADAKTKIQAGVADAQRDRDRTMVTIVAGIVALVLTAAAITTWQAAYYSAAVACQPGTLATSKEVDAQLNRSYRTYYYRIWDSRVICINGAHSKVVHRK